MFDRAAPEESAPSSEAMSSGALAVDADSGSSADSAATANAEWRQIHHTLLRLADESARLDWEIGVELLRAERARCHARLGFGSVIEYADRLFGYSPHTTEERLRVARSLETLPKTRDALCSGGTSWSAVRELTRVATPQTESEWLDAARDRRVREVQSLVRGRRPGDSPSDPSTAEAERHVLRFDVSAETYATFREAVGVLRRESLEPFDHDELLLLMARRVLAGPTDKGRASYQIAMTICEHCQQSWQEGRGELVPVGHAEREKAECDAQHIGSVSAEFVPERGSKRGAATSRTATATVTEDPAQAILRPATPSTVTVDLPQSTPRRPATPSTVTVDPPQSTPRRPATQSIPPATRRLVMRRHHGRCGVTGCRHASFIDVHHTELLSEGGTHDPDTMLPLCSAHHVAVHAGRLLIDGCASRGFTFRHADGRRYGAVPSAVRTDDYAKVFSALKHMGFKEKECRCALDVVRSHVGAEPTPETLLRAALEQLTPGSAA